MYEAFFGLTEKPFSIQPDPSFLYWGRAHRLAYAMLEYGVLNHAGISVITGEVGCGKTTLVHRLLDQLSESHAVALLSNIQEGRGELLSWVLMGFGQPFAGKSHVELFAALQAFFISEYAKGRRVVLIIDEAQNLSVDQLEEIRMLSNINAGKDQLLQLILVGQPQLKDLLNRPDMLQLAQRVGSDFHLTPLTREEVDAYIDTRLTIAGARGRIFSERAVDIVAEHSRGVPRVINIICDTALVYAFSAEAAVIDVETIENVIRDKADYGVFGLATDQRTALRSAAPSGPQLFVSDEPAPLRALSQEAGDQGRFTHDRPRMQAPLRSRPRVVAADSRDDRLSSPVDAVARPQFLAQPQPRPPASPAAAAHAGPPRVEPPDPIPSPRIEIAPDIGHGGVRGAGADAPPAENAEPAAPLSTAASPAVGVVVTATDASPEQAIRSATGVGVPIFVAQSTDQIAITTARACGAEVVEVPDKALTPGRARNAGYRLLKKAHPDLAYVQFVDAGFALDPAWLATAVKFMERRPEVAAIEGEILQGAVKPATFSRATEAAERSEPGEAQTVGSFAFVRADAFEGAGGFRGDLVVNETRDLCIRLRRRGAHVWRLDAPMGARESGPDTMSRWWAHSARRGYEYAHGAALHGAPPELFRRKERSRAALWGAIFPALILLGAAGAAGFVAIFATYANPLLVAASVLAFGAAAYVTKIALAAYALRGEPGALSDAFWSVIGHSGEAAGVWRYHFGRARGRQPPRAA